MVILAVVGARPNFVKMAPLFAALRHVPEFEPVLVHTEQHYSEEMSAAFFQDLALPVPDISLGVGSGTHGEQTARTMLAFEPIVAQRRPAMVLLVGDVNSTLACALVAAKLGVRIAHVEAGLRSFDRSMPEEINRVLTDQLSDLLFAPSADAVENLRQEGIPGERIHLVGNIMIDTLMRHREQAQALQVWRRWGLAPGRYAVLTLHRPSNVDDDAQLAELVQVVSRLQEDVPVVFPVHPRTAGRLQAAGLDGPLRRLPQLHLTEPLGYLEFLSLLPGSRLVLTDSGGVQEESTCLGISCLTLRPHTERPVTVTTGTNHVVGTAAGPILAAAQAALRGRAAAGVPPLWDGRPAGRIVDVLQQSLMPVAATSLGA